MTSLPAFKRFLPTHLQRCGKAGKNQIGARANTIRTSIIGAPSGWRGTTMPAAGSISWRSVRIRNSGVLESADQLWLSHVTPGGMLDHLVQEANVKAKLLKRSTW